MRQGYFLMAFWCVSVLFPAASPALSLEDAVQQGLESSLNLKKSLIDLSSAEYSAKRLWAEVFPTISGTVGASYSSKLFSGDGFELDKEILNTSAGAGIVLTLNAGIPFTMKNIKLAYQTRLLNYEDARNQLEIQITKNFYSLIADRDNLASLEYMLQLAQRQYDRDQVAFRNGVIGEMTLMQSRLGLQNARYSLSAARSAYTNRMSDFFSQLGIAHDADIALEGKIQIVKIEANADNLIREYLPRRPDIISRRQEIERLENTRKQLSSSGKAPSLSARLSADWTGQGMDPFIDKLSDKLSGSASITIPIDPWLPGTSRSQSVRAAKLAVDKARLDLQSAEDAAVAQIRSLAANLRNSWDSIEIARLSVGVAERGYELTDQGFRNGTVESLKLGDARNNLINARQRLLQAELSYLNMILDISAALNINWKDLMK
ncbi:MAG: TolC family protein [Treponema sp.]|nr:TolC family protein [Treponema sp.]